MTEKNLIVYIEEQGKSQLIGGGPESSAQSLQRIARNMGIEFASVPSVGAVTQDQYDRMAMLVTDAKPLLSYSGTSPLLEAMGRFQQQQSMATVLAPAVMAIGVPTLVIDPRKDCNHFPAIWRVDAVDAFIEQQIKPVIQTYQSGKTSGAFTNPNTDLQNTRNAAGKASTPDSTSR